MTASAEWEYFDSPQLSESEIAKEIARGKLNQIELIRLQALLTRIADGTAIPQKDFKHLKSEGLWELRFHANKRIFRLLYSRERHDRLVLVALLFLPKKQNKLPKQSFDTARKRLDLWRANHSTITNITDT